jgi:hypothetical protein
MRIFACIVLLAALAGCIVPVGGRGGDFGGGGYHHHGY